MAGNKFHPGDIVFLVESNRFIREAQIMRSAGGFYTIRFTDTNGGIRVKEHRLFSTKEEAENSIAGAQSSSYRSRLQ